MMNPSPSSPCSPNNDAHSNLPHATADETTLLARVDGSTASVRLTEPQPSGDPATFSQQRADDLLARIAWSRIAEPGDGTAGTLLAAIGATTALALLTGAATPQHIIELVRYHGADLTARAIDEALARWLPRIDRAATFADITAAAAAGITVVLPGDPCWPRTLDDLGVHAPIMLWVRGKLQHLSQPSLSVVGTRAATGYGSHVTAELVAGVCAAGIAIVSGAAYGIDAVAHRTALALDTPTLAVLAGGVDRAYPRAHETLLTRISTDGAVCAEMVPGSAPTKWRFLMRNRLIAALSQATLVTEAGIKSGSLNTAGHAAQLGRPLGAVPGPITSSSSSGCHRLLREYDATLISTPSEACELAGVTDELPIFDSAADSAASSKAVTGDSAWELRVRDALPLRGSRTLHEIAKLAGLSPEQVRGVLAELELLGLVRQRDSPSSAPRTWSLVRAQ